MPRLWCRQLLLACVLVTLEAQRPAASAAERPLQRGHQWVRSHPFTIMGLTRMNPKPFDVQEYRAAGFDTLMAWEPGTYDEILPIVSADHLPYHVNIEKWGDEEANRETSTEKTMREGLATLDSKENRAAIQKILKSPGCTGFLVNDEASRPNYLRYTRHVLKWLRQQHPEALVYSNAHPEGYDGDFDRYIDEFAAIINPDVLMTDIYPLGSPDGVGYNYYRLLAAVRRTALEHGMPYWLFIQSYETHIGGDRRLPSESDLRFQLFVPMAYGYTGILYFTYDIAFDRGLLDKNGEPNSAYHAAAKANPEAANLGTALRFLTSTDVRFVPGRHEEVGAIVQNPLPIDTKVWKSGAGGDKQITEISVISAGEGKDGLLGFFKDDRGDQYFMLTNLWHNADASAADRALDFTIKFTPDVKRLHRLDRISGKVEPLELEDGVLRLRLPGGTGDLIKYSAEPFPAPGRLTR